VYAFSCSESEESSALPSKASVVLDQDASGTYDYRIGVRDSVSETSITEDPKIIVGGKGGIEAELIELKSKLDVRLRPKLWKTPKNSFTRLKTNCKRSLAN
jgi:hypothetical protein